jgi:hypothetical protein
MCGLLAWQALGAWPGRAEIMQACASLRAWPSRDRECLWIPGLAGLKGSFHRDHVGGLWGGSLGQHSPGVAKKQGWRIRDPVACRAVALQAYAVGVGVQRQLFF